MCVCTEWINSFECCTAVINEEWQSFLHVCLLDYIKSILPPQNITLIANETAVDIEVITCTVNLLLTYVFSGINICLLLQVESEIMGLCLKL
jgi:hypothetical protein